MIYELLQKETSHFSLSNNMYKLFNQYFVSTVSKTDETEVGKEINMLFKEFLQQNIENLEIPYQPDNKKKYPEDVWGALHKTVLEQQLQHDTREKTIDALKTVILAGDDVGGLTIDNVIDMWFDYNMKNINQIVGSALANPKIREDYDKLVTEKDVECREPHNVTEDKLVKEGVELPVHTHVTNFIEVTDDNRENFEELTDIILKSFDSNIYGELPEEYIEAGKRDVQAMIAELKEVIGEKELARSLRDTDDPPDGDFV